MQESLDLIWWLDIASDDLKPRSDPDVRAGCADMKAAWELLEWVRNHFDARVLNAAPEGRTESVSEEASHRVEAWVGEVRKAAKGTPRFFDNREISFLEQLSKLVQQHATDSARNYIALGSGFYESSSDSSQIPSVIRSIVGTLQKFQLLTRNPEVDVFVNPNACQAIANSVAAFDHAGWKIRAPGIPVYLQQANPSLHAKFLFSATYRSNSEFCNSAWVYLGSGNLTGPGFASSMAPQSGNLEAGVVFAPKQLRWRAVKGAPPDEVVTNVLPLRLDEELNQTPEVLVAGNGMPEPEVRFAAAPVPYFLWRTDVTSGWLEFGVNHLAAFDVLDGAGVACTQEVGNRVLWQGPRPREVRVRWNSEDQLLEVWVPVVDEYGRVAATALPRIDLDEAWSQLANFPMPPEEEELANQGDLSDAEGALSPRSRGYADAGYAVRRMMQLIENIATKQTSVSQVDWTMWCTRLEQCLVQASASNALSEFLELRINPISPLWHIPFRPEFASTAATPEGGLYEESLRRIEAAWNVVGLPGFGDAV